MDQRLLAGADGFAVHDALIGVETGRRQSGGCATLSETAGLGAVLALIAVLDGLWRPTHLPPVSLIRCCFFPGIATAFPDAVMGLSTK